MTITVPLFAAKTKSGLGELGYRDKPLGNSQARLVGRYALEPEIDLNAFRCRAVIDWITICFWLGRKTQFQWLQDDIEVVLGRKPFVRPLDGEPGGVSETFDVKIQEPDLRKVRTACDIIDAKYGQEMLPFVRAMEISVDFTPKQPNDGMRAKLYTALTRHFWTDHDVISEAFDRPRFAWGQKTEDEETTGHVLEHQEGKPESVNEHFLISTEHDRAPFIDSTYYVGAEDKVIRWRVMDKVIDNQNRQAGTAIKLDDTDKRVRIEVTLDRPAVEALGVTFLQELGKLRFGRLQGRFFTFMLPTFFDPAKMPDSLGSAITRFWDRQRMEKFRKTGVIGLKAMDDALERWTKQMRKNSRGGFARNGLKMERSPRVGTEKSGTFLAYKKLNGRVADALHHLGERVAAAFSEV